MEIRPANAYRPAHVAHRHASRSSPPCSPRRSRSPNRRPRATSVGLTANGGTGNGVLVGSAGNDTPNGDANDDFIDGNDGADTIDCGANTDVADGGAGIDSAANCETTFNVP